MQLELLAIELAPKPHSSLLMAIIELIPQSLFRTCLAIELVPESQSSLFRTCLAIELILESQPSLFRTCFAIEFSPRSPLLTFQL
jgi:hypothetical protein